MNKPFYIFFLLFLLCFCCETKSQTNLVYNGDFEIYDTCPQNISTPGDLQIEHCLGWTAPTKLGTSDYYNVCNNSTTNKFAGVPKNFLGYQQPYNGNGYCGFYASTVDSMNNAPYIYREYLQAKLNQILIKNKVYHFSFNIVACGESSTHFLIKIGALFGDLNYRANTYAPIIAQPQVVNKNRFISDTLNWTKIEGDFIAIGNEEYVTIGYFESETLDTLNNHYDPFNPYYVVYSYYYIDAVELNESPCNLMLPNVFTPNGDNINDEFYIELCDSSDYKLSIYNRWGTQMFETTNTNKKWNGKDKYGIDCNEGIYYFVAESQTKKEKGFIQLVR